jgi:putative membrane protein
MAAKNAFLTLAALVKGGIIGLANIIPGVSGGTFALVLGVYERIIAAIGKANTGTLRIFLGVLIFRKERFRQLRNEWRRLDAGFLLTLGAGAVIAIGAASRLLEFLLADHPALTLAFFVGLIIPSVVVPYKMMRRKGPVEFMLVLSGAVAVFLISVFGSGLFFQGNLLTDCFCGALAMAAMILPGVSGSFLLLAFGQYQRIISAIGAFSRWGQSLFGSGPEVVFPFSELLTLSCFGLGALLGTLCFVRLLAWLLNKHRCRTLAFLIGLIVGSLWTLWPFKDYAPGKDLKKCLNIWPDSLGMSELLVVGAVLGGSAIVIIIMRFSSSDHEEGGEQVDSEAEPISVQDSEA